ncbi:MAG: DUF3014 domain-containing protein [Candidatus Aminicenantaceae bacterium]
MEEKQKVIFSVIVFVSLLLIGAVIYFLLIRDRAPEQMEERIVTQELEPREKTEPEEISRPDLEPVDVKLEDSDPVVRDMAAALSDETKFMNWLQTSRIINKFVAAVDNIAHGLSPRTQIDFFSLDQDFQAQETEDGWVVDPESYRRYDPAVEVFLSLDVAESVKLYYRFKPVLQEAYRELGYPDQDFTDTLNRAVQELNAVPVVSEPIHLEQKMMSYVMADSELENLSPAQKHFLRMGPENVRKVQSKLNEFQQALSNPEEVLLSVFTAGPY